MKFFRLLSIYIFVFICPNVNAQLIYGFTPGFSGSMSAFNVATGESNNLGQSGLHVDSSITFDFIPIPEPNSLALLGFGLAGFSFSKRVFR